MALVMGIDIGGTNLAGGIVESSGNILATITLPSGGAAGRDAVLVNLRNLIEKLFPLATGPIAAIGIGTAGEVEPKSGVITSATDNIPNWTGTRLKEYVQGKYGLPTYVDNDGNAGALAESRFGAGRGLQNFVYLCLGTGVGGAVLANGQVLRGTRNYAGALGHTSIDFAGNACNCGSYGCLETYVSGSAIGIAARDAKIAADAKGLFCEAEKGDERAKAVVAKVGFYLGCGLANFANQFDPEAIIIGGGVSKAGNLLLDPAKAIMEERVLQGLKGKVQVLAAKFGHDSGLIGGAVVAFDGLIL